MICTSVMKSTIIMVFWVVCFYGIMVWFDSLKFTEYFNLVLLLMVSCLMNITDTLAKLEGNIIAAINGLKVA